MNTCRLWRQAFACALLFPTLAAQAKVVFQNGFESYASGAAAQGLPIGTGAWGTQGVQPGDIAQVSSIVASDGANSLRIADNGANRPRAYIDLVTSGHVTTPIAAGSVSVDICEDPNDGGVADAFNLSFGAISIVRGAGTTLWLSVTGGTSVAVPFAGTGYTYTAGAWNTFRVDFDNVAKTATLFINGASAGTVTGAGANFTVGLVTLGTYASTPTGDALYFDELSATMKGNFFAAGLENYTAGANIGGQTAGATTWTAAGLNTGDVAQIASGGAYEGTKSLSIADNVRLGGFSGTPVFLVHPTGPQIIGILRAGSESMGQGAGNTIFLTPTYFLRPDGSFDRNVMP